MGEQEDPWRAARRFDELCALGARFVEGDLERFPGWGGRGLDEESDALVPVLAACNRAGFLTVASQPAEPFAPGHDGRAWARRAFVAGFAAPAAARRLAALDLESELFVGIFAAQERGGTRVAVGQRGGVAFAGCGHAAGPEELELFRPHLAPAGLEALAAASYVAVVDLVWGRREHLWSQLARALCPPLELPPGAP